jgi:hypothetical protein
MPYNTETLAICRVFYSQRNNEKDDLEDIGVDGG